MLTYELDGVDCNVEFPNRCFFCFEKVPSDFDGVSFDTSGQVPLSVDEFQEVFQHLVPNHDKTSILFGGTPPVCEVCGTLLQLLHSAIRQLASALNAVKSRIANLGNCSTNKEETLYNFLADLNKSPTRLATSVETILAVLEKIGHGQLQDYKEAWFPMSAETTIEKKMEVCPSPEDELISDTKIEDDDWGIEEGGFDADVGESSQQDIDEEPISSCAPVRDELDPLSDRGSRTRRKRIHEEESDDDDEDDLTFNSSLEEDSGSSSSEDEIPKKGSRSLKKCSRRGKREEVVSSEDDEEVSAALEKMKSVRNKGGRPKAGRPRSVLNCDFCGILMTPSNALKHVQSHVGTYATLCPNASCHGVFSNLVKYKAHMGRYPECRQFMRITEDTCQICGYQAEHLRMLKSHLKDNHETLDTPFHCPVSSCSEKFTCRQSILLHLSSHTLSNGGAPPSTQPCPECDSLLPQEKLRKHLVSNHEILEDSIVSCNFCPFLFPSRHALVEHLCIHIQKGVSVSCDLCQHGKSFIVARQLRKHYIVAHQIGHVDSVCEFCNKVFFARRTYKDHVAKYHPGQVPAAFTSTKTTVGKVEQVIVGNKSNQICDFCRQSVPFGNILEHVRDHVGDFAIPCSNPLCKYVFTTFVRLDRHCKSSFECISFAPKDFRSCEICGYRPKNILSLRTHLRVVHETVEKPYQCPVPDCPERFTHRQSVQCHIAYHASNNQRLNLAPASFQACPECQIHLPQEGIKEHLETEHQVPAESVINCKYCPYLFSTRLQLIKHFEIHVKAGIPVACDLCEDNRKYLRLGKLMEHYRTEHEVGGYQFVCEHCSKSFADESKLKWHVSSVHIGRPKAPKEIFKCPECPEKEFATEISLMNHTIKFHGADPFKCATCAEEFNDWKSFVRHEREHKGVLVEDKDFSCDLPGCGKRFKSKNGLELHKRSVIHVGKTNAFICGQCGRGFNYSERLRSHERSVHSEERKFVCEDCGERFKTGHVLRKHKRIHSGEKRFQCDICQQRFRYSEVLRRHVEAHQRKGSNFKPKGPMQNVRKRVNPK